MKAEVNIKPESDAINLLDVWVSIKKNIRTILSVTVISTIAAIFYAISIENVYRASILAVPASSESQVSSPLSGIGDQFAGLASMAGIDLSGGQLEIETNIAVIESKQFTKIFLEGNNILEKLYPEAWDKESNNWKQGVRIPTFDDILKDLNGVQNIIFDKRSGLLSVTVDLNDPNSAAEWANSFMRTANNHLRDMAIKEAKKNIGFLNNELLEVKVVQMKQLLNQMIAAETQKIMIANTRDDYAFKIIDPAFVPDKKIRPQRSLIVIFGALIGLLFSSFLSFYRTT
tara:strand:- start:1265 stop:2125 length:861 start_codon:yes stop_codon:yes gene_type:complete